jgi:hypothetical protein
LKELFDAYSEQLGTWVYVDTREELLAESRVYQVLPGMNKQVIKEQFGPGKKDFIEKRKRNI